MSILFVLLTFLLILTVMYFRRPEQAVNTLAVAPAKTAAPQPPKTSQKVPKNSAIQRFLRETGMLPPMILNFSETTTKCGERSQSTSETCCSDERISDFQRHAFDRINSARTNAHPVYQTLQLGS